MPDKANNHISRSGLISSEEIAAAEAMVAAQRQEGHDASIPHDAMPAPRSVTGAVSLQDALEAIKKSDDANNDEAPTG